MLLTIGDTVLEVYSGSCSSPTSLACNDRYCGRQSRVTVSVSDGAILYVRVGSYGGGVGGDFSLRLYEVFTHIIMAHGPTPWSAAVHMNKRSNQ